MVIAAAIQNMHGGREVYDGFYLYVALCAAYFMPGRYLKIVVGVIAVASAVPLLTDAGSDSIVRWVYVGAGNATVAAVLRAARKRVRAYAAETRAMALQDQLTQTLNRRGFEARANEEIARARRHRERFMLVYLDLDGFKRVNDNLNHAAGDRVLRRAAQAMCATLRGEDTLARVGGDEFVALLPQASEPDAAGIARRLVDAVEEMAAGEPGAEHLSATTAWSAFPADGDTLDALLNAADARMLERKRARPPPPAPLAKPRRRNLSQVDFVARRPAEASGRTATSGSRTTSARGIAEIRAFFRLSLRTRSGPRTEVPRRKNQPGRGTDRSAQAKKSTWEGNTGLAGAVV